MAPSYHSRVSSTQNQGVPFFSYFGSWNLILYLYIWVKSKIFDNSSLPILIENGK